MMSITQGVQHTFYRIIWLPVIVNYNSDDIRQETAALGADTIEGQQGGGRHMQPLRLAADAKPGLVHVASLARRPRGHAPFQQNPEDVRRKSGSFSRSSRRPL